MKIRKTSSVKNRIDQFAITNPDILLFVRKYEDKVFWSQMVPANAYEGGRENAQQQINRAAHYLLTDLHNMMKESSGENAYVKSVDLESEAMQANDNPDIAAAVDQYRVNPDAAQRKVMEIINGDKRDAFESWWEYMTETYAANHACFAYVMIDAILKVSNEKVTNPPPPMNSHAVAALFDDLDGNDMNVMSEYTEKVTKVSRGVKKSFSDGWIMIPGREKSEENPEKWGTFEENLSVLRTYGSAGKWCIGGKKFSHDYLYDGDFHIMVENGRPMIAIRLNGNELAEIDGRGNDKGLIQDYWEEITSFLHASDIDYEGNSQYQNLQDFVEENSYWEDYPEVVLYDEMKGFNIKYISGVAGRMSRENKEKFSEVFVRVIEDHIKAYRNIFPKRDMMEVRVEKLGSLPEEFHNLVYGTKTRGRLRGTDILDRDMNVLYYKGAPQRPFYIPETEQPISVEEAYGRYIEGTTGGSGNFLDRDLENFLSIMSQISTVPKFVMDRMDIASALGPLSFEAAHFAANKTSVRKITWANYGHILERVFGEDEWRVIVEDMIELPGKYTMNGYSYSLFKKMSEMFGNEYLKRLEDAEKKSLYQNVEDLEYIAVELLKKYTDYESYYIHNREYHEDEEWGFDADACHADSANDCRPTISEMAADEGKMHLLASDEYLETYERINGWDETFEKNADNWEMASYLMENHEDKIQFMSTGTAEIFINSNPEHAYEVVRQLGGGVSFPLSLSEDAVIELESGFLDSSLWDIADIDSVDLSLFDSEFIERAVLGDPPYGMTVPEIIQKMDKNYVIDEDVLDEYFRERGDRSAIPELAATGNISVMRYLKNRISPADVDIHVAPRMTEEDMEMVNRPQQDSAVDSNQMELPLSSSATWMKRAGSELATHFMENENSCARMTIGSTWLSRAIVSEPLSED